jgi:hypothetical protein
VHCRRNSRMLPVEFRKSSPFLLFLLGEFVGPFDFRSVLIACVQWMNGPSYRITILTIV